MSTECTPTRGKPQIGVVLAVLIVQIYCAHVVPFALW